MMPFLAALGNSGGLCLAAPNAGMSQEAIQMQEFLDRLRNDETSITFGSRRRKLLGAIAEAELEEEKQRRTLRAARPYAERLLDSLKTSWPEPEVDVDPDGEVCFEWSRGRNWVFSISIGEGGRLSYASLLGSSTTHGTEYLVGTIPETIAAALDRFVRQAQAG